MEASHMNVFNEPQLDGSVIQYDGRGRVIACFESDEACLDAMGIARTAEIPTVGEEIRDGIYAIRRASREVIHEVIGERSHAA